MQTFSSKGYIYILSNKNRTTFYIGVTNNLERRISEHKLGKGSFSSRYNLYDLIYYEEFPQLELALKREKQLKNWHRDWKMNLIRKMNPEMTDLAKDW